MSVACGKQVPKQNNKRVWNKGRNGITHLQNERKTRKFIPNIINFCNIMHFSSFLAWLAGMASQ